MFTKPGLRVGDVDATLSAGPSINNLLDNKYERFATFAPDPRRRGSPVAPFLTPAPPIPV